MVGCAVALALAFALYVWAENKIDGAHKVRHQSVLLADELRQSSDDLTRMVRTHVLTGDPIYKQHYQDILDIRNGEKPRPKEYGRMYWDLVLKGGKAPRPASTQTIPLLELMRGAAFTEEEFRKLERAEANSEKLTTVEFEAMELVASAGPGAEADRATASRMLHDASYHEAKAGIMQPLYEFAVLVDQRTSAAVKAAENAATFLRYLFVAFGLLLMAALWRLHLALRDILGGSVDEVHAHFVKIGGGDFSPTLRLKEGRKDSVLAWLLEMQAKLNRSDHERKRTEETLRESDANFRQLAENITDAFWIHSADMQEVHYVSPGFERIWGRPREYFYGKPQQCTEFIVPEDCERVRNAFATLLGAAASLDLEYRILRPDGEQRWIHNRAFQVRDAAGELVRLTGICSDITDQRHAEESLRVQAHILDHIGQAVIATELGGRISYANRFAGELYRWAPGEMIGRNIMDVTVPQISREVAGRIMAQLERGESWNGEFGVRRRDGTEFPVWVTNTQIRGSSGEILGVVGISEDITERKRAEEALRTSERRLEKALQENQQVLDKSLDVICTIDAAGHFTSVSAACEKLLGYSPAEVIGRPFLEFILEDDRASSSVAAAQLPAGRELHDYENRYVRKDGRAVTISWSAMWSDADQSIFCVGRDCTERKQAEEAHAARLVAERANAAKSEFLSRMSHELRTPMNAILGFAQVLESEDGLNAEQLDSVDHILKGGAHLLKLINEVLDITSIEAGGMTISSEAVGLHGLLEEAVSLLRPLSAEFNVRTSLVADENAASYVRADRQRLKQVLLNLLSNAIKYNRPGGSVTVRCHAADGFHAKVRLSITDTGAGLDAAKLSGLFHPFERLGAERTAINGTGLGLVLSKRMVEHMGGVLGVESVVGEGSTFWIDLPAAEPPAEPEETTEDTEPLPVLEVSAKRQVVLSIEDNPSNVRLITRILGRRPAVHFLNAETAAGGLSMAREFRPDLILLDLHLPDSDGARVLERLAADPRTAAIPVVVMTADALSGKREKLLAGGADDFLAKPVDVRAFLEIVDRLLNSTGGESEVARGQIERG